MHGIFKPKQQFNLSSTVTPFPLPRNPKTAFSDPNWKFAMADEFNALIDTKTRELVPRPSNVKIIRSMWFFVIKRNLMAILSGIKPVLFVMAGLSSLE